MKLLKMDQMSRLVIVLLGMMFVPTALADEKVETAYRQAVMKSVGGHMGAMAGIAKNGVHMEDIGVHARGMAALADLAPDVFAADTQSEKSKAMDAIWEDPEAFSMAMDKFVVAAKNMPAAADTGDRAQIGQAMQALGGSCKGCHDDFKEE